MKLSKLLNDYKLRKKQLTDYVIKNGIKDIPFFISFAAIHTVVIYYWIMVEFEEYKEFGKDNFERLAKFYKIDNDMED